MSQPTSDLPRFVQIIGQYRGLVGIMAMLGLLGGAVFAALNPPVFTSQALVRLPAVSCPAGAICGGPAFAHDYLGTRLLRSVPADARMEPLPGDVLLVSATAGTAAQAEASANAAGRSYLAYEDSLNYSSGQASAPVLEPATQATGTPPLIRVLGDALVGAVLGALLGVIAALAGSGGIVDTLTAPPMFGAGEGFGTSQEFGTGAGWGASEEQERAGRERVDASRGVPIEQLALEYLKRKAAGESPPAAETA